MKVIVFIIVLIIIGFGQIANASNNNLKNPTRNSFCHDVLIDSSSLSFYVKNNSFEEGRLINEFSDYVRWSLRDGVKINTLPEYNKSKFSGLSKGTRTAIYINIFVDHFNEFPRSIARSDQSIKAHQYRNYYQKANVIQAYPDDYEDIIDFIELLTPNAHRAFLKFLEEKRNREFVEIKILRGLIDQERGLDQLTLKKFGIEKFDANHFEIIDELNIEDDELEKILHVMIKIGRIDTDLIPHKYKEKFLSIENLSSEREDVGKEEFYTWLNAEFELMKLGLVEDEKKLHIALLFAFREYQEGEHSNILSVHIIDFFYNMEISLTEEADKYLSTVELGHGDFFSPKLIFPGKLSKVDKDQYIHKADGASKLYNENLKIGVDENLDVLRENIENYNQARNELKIIYRALQENSESLNEEERAFRRYFENYLAEIEGEYETIGAYDNPRFIIDSSVLSRSSALVKDAEDLIKRYHDFQEKNTRIKETEVRIRSNKDLVFISSNELSKTEIDLEVLAGKVVGSSTRGPSPRAIVKIDQVTKTGEDTYEISFRRYDIQAKEWKKSSVKEIDIGNNIYRFYILNDDQAKLLDPTEDIFSRSDDLRLIKRAVETPKVKEVDTAIKDSELDLKSEIAQENIESNKDLEFNPSNELLKMEMDLEVLSGKVVGYSTKGPSPRAIIKIDFVSKTGDNTYELIFRRYDIKTKKWKKPSRKEIETDKNIYRFYILNDDQAKLLDPAEDIFSKSDELTLVKKEVEYSIIKEIETPRSESELDLEIVKKQKVKEEDDRAEEILEEFILFEEYVTQLDKIIEEAEGIDGSASKMAQFFKDNTFSQIKEIKFLYQKLFDKTANGEKPTIKDVLKAKNLNSRSQDFIVSFHQNKNDFIKSTVSSSTYDLPKEAEYHSHFEKDLSKLPKRIRNRIINEIIPDILNENFVLYDHVFLDNFDIKSFRIKFNRVWRVVYSRGDNGEIVLIAAFKKMNDGSGDYDFANIRSKSFFFK